MLYIVSSTRLAATEHTAMDVLTMSILLQIAAAFLATSATLGSTLGVALDARLRRAGRRHQQDIALLMRSRPLRRPMRLSRPSGPRCLPMTRAHASCRDDTRADGGRRRPVCDR